MSCLFKPKLHSRVAVMTSNDCLRKPNQQRGEVLSGSALETSMKTHFENDAYHYTDSSLLPHSVGCHWLVLFPSRCSNLELLDAILSHDNSEICTKAR
jgi:hypothetical protein